ncbi:DUF7115 domain-containing protein [Halosimplex amylolyticum]|uniref:DUF7115 domain-containing protein n=1 Tax=Halosimplex amylolyticum TaxID=3396616 RepID=UPI003F577F8E
MDIPDLVKGALGDEEIQAGVSLGDEDAVCLTPTRTLVYRGEGLLSDEQVEEYSHDIEQLAVSEGRRKTKFTMQYIDGTDSFTVPANRGDKVLTLFLEGVLRLDGVIEPRESVAGVYRFSELTLIITEGRLIKHIGNQVWTEDFEVYPYEDVTGLEFERASVATSIALAVDGRPQRVKVPNDKAPVVRQTLEEALFGYYDVGSIEELNRVVGADDAGEAAVEEADDDGFAFGDDFDPLVSDEDDELAEPLEATDGPDEDAFTEQPADAGRSTQAVESSNQSQPAPDQPTEAPSGQSGSGTGSPANASGGAVAGSQPGNDQTPGADVPEQPQSSDPGQHQSSNPEQPQSSGSESAGPQSSGAATADATASSPDGRQGRGTSQEQPQQTAQNATTGSAEARGGGGGSPAESGPTAADSAPTVDGPDRSTETEVDRSSASAPSSTADQSVDSASGTPVSREEYEALAERVEELTDAVDRQNELLKRQHRALKQLVQQNQQSE